MTLFGATILEGNMALNVGTTVKLKSGGPLMTVEEPNAHAGGKPVVKCTWFDKGELKSGLFPAETLTETGIPKPVRLMR
jgi:uncharacterized protein YodC (DUF2158 family)